MILTMKFVLFRLICIFVLTQLVLTQSSPPTPPTPDPTKYKEQKCEQYSDYSHTWVTYDGVTCIKTPDSYYDEATTWDEARDFCLRLNATLASIHSYDINYLLSHRKTGSTANVLWIGLNSLAKRGQYKWSDGSPSDYTNYSNKTSSGDLLPTNINDQGRCVSIRSIRTDSYQTYNDIGKWFKDDCQTEHKYLCEKRLDQIAPPTDPPKTPGNCSEGWYKYGSEKCIQYVIGKFNHTQAKQKCVSLGGQTLAIHSALEQNFITLLTAGKPEPYIGFSRSNYYYGWEWGDQTSTTFTNWGLQPSNYYANCAYIVTNSSQPGKWIQTNCSANYAVVCEKDQDDTISDKSLTLISNKCKIPGFENFVQFKNSCYSLIDSKESFSNFTEAENNCRAMNGSHLLSIVDPFDQTFIKYIVKQYGKSDKYWIGLQSKVQSDTNMSQIFEWTDDWPVYITDWNKGEPLFPDLPQEECVYLYKDNGTWRTGMCDSNFAYICKITTNKIPKLNTDKSGVCPQLFNTTDKSLLWVDLDRRSDKCFWFSVDRKVNYYNQGMQSWTDSSFHCRRRNGTLVSIHSTHEIMLLKSKFNQTGSSYNTWIGLSKNYLGVYQWEDGSALDYTNWDPNEKIVRQIDDLNDDSGRMCVESTGMDGMWKQAACSSNKRNYFVCEVRKTYPTHPITSTPNPGSTQSPNIIGSTKPNDKTEKSNEQKGLTGGAKAGIAFGVIAGVAVILVIGFFALKRYRPNSTIVTSFENSLYRSKRNTNREPQDSHPVSWSRENQ